MLEDLRKRMLQTSADLKAKHVKELSQLKKLKDGKYNHDAKEKRQQGKYADQQCHPPTEYGPRLRSRSRTKSESHEIDSSHDISYYDNLNALF